MSITADPTIITTNDTSQISWSSGADSWSDEIRSGDIGTVTSPNPYTYVPNGTGVETFTLYATGPGTSGSSVTLTKSVDVTINQGTPPPGFSTNLECNSGGGWATTCSTNYNTTVNLRWTATGASSCTGNWPTAGTAKPTSHAGQASSAVTANGTTFTISCSNGGGTTNRSVTVNVNAPTVDLRCNTSNGPCNVTTGTSATLSWTSTSATVCTASNAWTGNKTPVAAGSESSPLIAGSESNDAFAMASQDTTLIAQLNTSIFENSKALIGDDVSPSLAKKESSSDKFSSASSNEDYALPSKVLAWLGIETAQAVNTCNHADGVVCIQCDSGSGYTGTCTVPSGSSINLRTSSHHANGTGSWAANCYYDWNYPSSWTNTNTLPSPNTGTRNWDTTLTNLTQTRTYGWRCHNGTYGNVTDTLTVNVTAPVDNATFVSQTINGQALTQPAYMTIGDTYAMVVTMQNSGTTTWNSAGDYKLGSRNPSNNTTWGTSAIEITSGNTTNGQQKAFSFNAIPPSSAGTHNFQWRVRKGVSGGWFGADSTNVPVNVLADGSYGFTLTCTNPAGGSATDSVIVQSSPNGAPTTSNVRVTEPDYCALPPSAPVSWSYSDPDGNPQASFQVEVHDNAGFTSLIADSTQQAGSQTSYTLALPVGTVWNKVLYARVRTWDSAGAASNWQGMTLCTGPGCDTTPPQTFWTTPQHAYPSGVDFTWTPANPAVNQLVQFSDATTTCYTLGGGIVPCTTYVWTFAGGTPATSNASDPTSTFATTGSHAVTLRVTDAQGYVCPAAGPLSKNVNVQGALPSWKEVAPR